MTAPLAPVTTAVVVGDPKPRSRTLTAATYVARELCRADPDLVVDVAALGAELVDWKASELDDLVERVGKAGLVVACPTYKATYTGLLTLFLGRFSVGQLGGVAVPLMLGAGAGQALAPELGLRPLLAHLGAVVPTAGLHVPEQEYDDPAAYADWLERARPVVSALLSRPEGVPA